MKNNYVVLLQKGNVEKINFAALFKPNDTNSICDFANQMVENSSQKDLDDFWIQNVKMYLEVGISYLAYWADKVSVENKTYAPTMESLFCLLKCEDDILDDLFNRIKEKDAGDFSVEMYEKFKIGSGKTTKSIKVSVLGILSEYVTIN